MVTNACYNPVQILVTPILGLEDVAMVASDTAISLTNLCIQDGYQRLYALRLDREKRKNTLLLYLYQTAVNSWINVAGAHNFMTPAEYLNTLAELEKVRQTCECYNLN